MSSQSSKWLNNNIIVGFALARGNGWWRDDSLRAPGFVNHYDGAIPLDRATEFFGRWHPLEVPSFFRHSEFDSDGNETVSEHPTGEKTIYRSDNMKPVGNHGLTYQQHDRVEWLIDRVGHLIDDDLQIGSVGEIDGGAVAWVQIEAPDSISLPNGEKYRPFIAATTSLDGTMATTYKGGSTRIVCDNTRSAFFGEKGGAYKVRHTANSTGNARIQDIRQALDIVHTIGADYESEMDALMGREVTPGQWDAFLNLYAPLTDDKGKAKEGRQKTIATNVQEALHGLYTTDIRVAPWNGSAWGVLQAASTYDQHLKTVRGVGRPERQWGNFLKGRTDQNDQEAMNLLNQALTSV